MEYNPSELKGLDPDNLSENEENQVFKLILESSYVDEEEFYGMIPYFGEDARYAARQKADAIIPIYRQAEQTWSETRHAMKTITAEMTKFNQMIAPPEGGGLIARLRRAYAKYQSNEALRAHFKSASEKINREWAVLERSQLAIERGTGDLGQLAEENLAGMHQLWLYIVAGRKLETRVPSLGTLEELSRRVDKLVEVMAICQKRQSDTRLLMSQGEDLLVRTRALQQQIEGWCLEHAWLTR